MELNFKEIVRETAHMSCATYKDTTIICESFLNIIKAHIVAEDKIKINKFGTFEKLWRKGHIGRNPRKPTEEYEIESRPYVKFRASKNILSR